MIPKRDWTDLSQRTIWHGRRICHASKPACGACALARDCPSYGIGPADPEVGRQAGQDRCAGGGCRGEPRPALGGASRSPLLAAGCTVDGVHRPAPPSPAGAEAGPGGVPRARRRRPPPGPRCPTCRCPAWARPKARRRVPLRRLTGRPTVVNLWASWCAPCRRGAAGAGPAAPDRRRPAPGARRGQPGPCRPTRSRSRPTAGCRSRSLQDRGRRPGAGAAPHRAAGHRAGPAPTARSRTSTRAPPLTDATLRAAGPGQARRRCLSRPRPDAARLAGAAGRRPSGRPPAADFLRSARRRPAGGGRRSAVLILLAGPAPDVLLIQRSDQLRKHAGQPAFPGGAADPDDDGPVDTALREAAEEVGLDPAGVEVVAALPELFLPPTGFAGHAGAGLVAHARTRSAWSTPARSPGSSGCRWPSWPTRPTGAASARPSGYAGPAFTVRGMIVWGFTAAVLDRMLELGGWARPWDADDVRDLPQRELDLAARGVPPGYGPVPRGGPELPEFRERRSGRATTAPAAAAVSAGSAASGISEADADGGPAAEECPAGRRSRHHSDLTEGGPYGADCTVCCVRSGAVRWPWGGRCWSRSRRAASPPTRPRASPASRTPSRSPPAPTASSPSRSTPATTSASTPR